MNSILKYFPESLRNKIEEECKDKFESLEEIRIRGNKPIILKFNDSEKVIKYLVSVEDLLGTLQLVCENSIYSYQNQIAEGFVTIKGGHRVGISGSCIIENGKVININYICSLNFRIAKQVIGSSNKHLSYILNIEENSIYNTLIVSSPGGGKTTLLRDIVRQISSGIKEIKYKALNVGIVDERGEIAALYKGIPQNDVGIKTDIVENVNKEVGMKMLIRSMAPDVIVADEIGKIEDIEAINYAMCSGCKGIFTAHGTNFKDIILNPVLKSLLSMHLFEVIIFLDEKNKGNIKNLYRLNKKKEEYEEI